MRRKTGFTDETTLASFSNSKGNRAESLLADLGVEPLQATVLLCRGRSVKDST
jgi:hypothetical protein